MKKTLAKGFILITSLSFITSCSGSVRDTLGMRRSAPNEFRVVSNPPLSVPPEFSIRPPIPEGTYKEVIKSKAEDARTVFFENASADLKIKSEKQTAGEQAFGSLFNSNVANPEIKSLLHKEFIEAAKKEEEKSFLEQKILSKIPSFSSDKEKNTEPVVDAKSEKNRIVETKKIGEKLTGDETPTVESKKGEQGILNRILGL
ncbi:MAG: DUF3035 domain-containing protein [Rickettsiales bacterium]|nr:DUF3035 domain-containing protein [Pseudomonadota bacterium]MDA0965984.1 DUF3035 domain-containing protein [Pseudomonadota bacterium]MDG4542545.1 DUF3035 domain-containing protein [Rickettsiales bacterium]MDG4545049.1 DUF3035 domain-containing protein [Rickettsiales bacterium]MDG4547172.1 DUF3035 domain-containing protein [Rickettsiales bacterium]